MYVLIKSSTSDFELKVRDRNWKQKRYIQKEKFIEETFKVIALGEYIESLGREEEVSRKLRSDTLNVVEKKETQVVMDKEVSRRHKSKGKGPRNGEDDG